MCCFCAPRVHRAAYWYRAAASSPLDKIKTRTNKDNNNQTGLGNCSKNKKILKKIEFWVVVSFTQDRRRKTNAIVYRNSSSFNVLFCIAGCFGEVWLVRGKDEGTGETKPYAFKVQSKLGYFLSREEATIKQYRR